jgi:MFS family permease
VSVFLIFLAAYVLSQFFRSFLAVIAPELGVELDLTASDLGLASAAWFATFSLAQFVVGWALDAIGPRRTVPIGMLAAAAGSLLFWQAHDKGACIAAMALIGVGCAPILMGALYVFGRSYPPERFALLSSAMIGFGSIGNLLAATPLAYAARTIGWRTSFLIIAAITLIAALPILVLIKDPPRSVQREGGGGFLHGLGEIVSNRALWPLLPLTWICYSVLAAERGLWVGPYLAEVHGLEPVLRGNIVLVMAAAMSFGALVYGPLEQLAGTRKGLVMGGTLVTALTLLALGLLPDLSLTAATALLAIMGAAGLTYGVLMAHARPLFPTALLGRGITFMNFGFIGGAGILQVLSGRYVDHLKAAGLAPTDVYAALHLAFAASLLVAAFIYAFAKEKR